MKEQIDAITIGARHRNDLGDIKALAASIASIGLLHPIVVTPDRYLIAGARRLAACRSLDWSAVPITVVSNLDDAAARLHAERDENTCRKALTVSERLALVAALEPLERAAARERQLFANPSGHSPEGSATDQPQAKGEALEHVAAAVGWSRNSINRARKVAAAVEQDPALQPILDQMNRSGNIAAALRQIPQQYRARKPPQKPIGKVARDARICDMARGGHRVSDIAREASLTVGAVHHILKAHHVKPTAAAPNMRQARHNANRIAERTVLDAENLTADVGLINRAALDVDQIPGWIARLRVAEKGLRAFIALLRREHETSRQRIESTEAKDSRRASAADQDEGTASRSVSAAV